MQNRNSDLAEPVMAGYRFFRLTCVTIIIFSRIPTKYLSDCDSHLSI